MERAILVRFFRCLLYIQTGEDVQEELRKKESD